MKLLERKFALPGSASILALMNDAAHLGFDFRTICVVVGASLIYAAIEAAVDIARIRWTSRPTLTVGTSTTDVQPK